MGGKFYFIFIKNCGGCNFWKNNYHMMFTDFLKKNGITFEEIAHDSPSFPFGKTSQFFSWAPVFIFVPVEAKSISDVHVFNGNWDGKKFVSTSTMVPESQSIEDWFLTKKISTKPSSVVSTVTTSDSGLW